LVEQIVANHDEFVGAYGPVHGDLHPKNIVFDDADKANIIDFGWATNGRHVVVDYLLLDINLRAMTMASQIPENQLLGAAKCLALDDQPEADADERLQWRLQAVRDVIWKIAQDRKAVSSATGKEWLQEYLIPYFLVAYGLLVYLDNAQNQRALLACVLAAAERIQRELLKIT
jgi:serine/threonine protein kinase